MGERETLRADEDGLRQLIDSGEPPDRVVLAVFDAFRETIAALMKTIGKDKLSKDARIQVMALATVIDNATTAMRVEMVAVPAEAIIVLADAMAAMPQEGRTRAGRDSPDKESSDGDNATNE